MIVIDSSIIVAIFLKEPDAHLYVERVADEVSPLLSAGSLLETSIVLRSRKMRAPPIAEAWLDEVLATFGVVIEPVTIEQARIARFAHLTFGKGSGHPARLNFGDCFAYALARATGAPLLFKGEDFRRTDIESAL